MKEQNKDNIIHIYKIKPKNYIRHNNNKNITLKKSCAKSNTIFDSNSFISSQINERLKDDSKNTLIENNDKRNQLILPLINNISINNKSIVNISLNDILKNKNLLTPIKKSKINLKKTEINRLKRKNSQNKNLKKLYHESSLMKKRLKLFKKKNIQNMRKFSYKNYNYHLVKYSSMNLSYENFITFKKNMESIESTFNGQRIQIKDRWMVFLDKIGDSISEGLKKKLKSLSESRYIKKYDNIKNNNIINNK